MKTKHLKNLAEKYGWKLEHPQPNPWLLSFEKDGRKGKVLIPVVSLLPDREDERMFVGLFK